MGQNPPGGPTGANHPQPTPEPTIANTTHYQPQRQAPPNNLDSPMTYSPSPRGASRGDTPTRSRRPLIVGGVILVTLIALLIISVVVYSLVGTTGIALGPLVIGPQEQISGAIKGQELAQRMQGYVVSAPLAATVTCAGVSAHTNSAGVYSLTLAAAKSYACAIVAGANYAPVKLTLTGHGRTALTLNVGAPNASAACPAASAQTSVTCAALTLLPAMLHGTVTDAKSGQPIANASVRCWNDDAALAKTTQLAQTFSATANATGAYTLSGLPPDHYACVGADAGTLHRVALTAGQRQSFDIATCAQHCTGVLYHQGAVMHTMTAYLDFWLPNGQSYEPFGSDSQYERLIKQYFQDIGGTAYYGLLTQYWDEHGPVRNSMTLGGVYVDKTPYPHVGSLTDPLQDGDVQASIHRTLAATHWPADGKTDEVFVFTGFDIQECFGSSCTFLHSLGDTTAFCAYHNVTNDNIIYAYAPNVLFCYLQPTFTSAIPYNDITADAVIGAISHEQFESATDPINGSGWNDANGEEIGDLCASTFGKLDSQGGTVRLAHGHSYAIQAEWSNVANGCAYS